MTGYAMQTTRIAVATLEEINRLYRNILWFGDGNKRGLNLVGWIEYVYPRRWEAWELCILGYGMMLH